MTRAPYFTHVTAAKGTAVLLRWQVPGDLLRSAKYTCSVPDALAQDMAQGLGLNLQQYVH